MVALLTAVTVITASVINVTSYVAAAPAGQTDTADGAGAETASGSTDTAGKKEDNKDEESYGRCRGQDRPVQMDHHQGL